jgi:hypothetical protein
MEASSIPANPLQFLEALSVEQLRQRIADLEAESKAVRVLLRSALARERELRRRNALPTPMPKGDSLAPA